MKNPLFTEAQLNRMTLITGWRHVVAPGPGIFHEHSGFELVYHSTGNGTVRLPSGKAIPFSAGDIVITPSRIKHAQFNRNEGEDFCVVADFPGIQIAPIPHIIVIPQISNDYIIRELEYLTSGLVMSDSNTYRVADFRLRALFAFLLTGENDTSDTTATRDDYVNTACRIMDESYSDVKLEIRKVAAEVGISCDYLRHLFLQQLGQGPKQYLLQRRIERVKELLSHSNLLLKEIAELSGFANERYLCRYFRQKTGYTPDSFRRCHCGGNENR